MRGWRGAGWGRCLLFICHTSVPVGLLLPQASARRVSVGVPDVTDVFLMFTFLYFLRIYTYSAYTYIHIPI